HHGFPSVFCAYCCIHNTCSIKDSGRVSRWSVGVVPCAQDAASWVVSEGQADPLVVGDMSAYPPGALTPVRCYASPSCNNSSSSSGNGVLQTPHTPSSRNICAQRSHTRQVQSVVEGAMRTLGIRQA